MRHLKNLLKRISNIWKLSGQEITPGLYEFKSNLEPERKMAQIIRKDNLEDILR